MSFVSAQNHVASFATVQESQLTLRLIKHGRWASQIPNLCHVPARLSSRSVYTDDLPCVRRWQLWHLGSSKPAKGANSIKPEKYMSTVHPRFQTWKTALCAPVPIFFDEDNLPCGGSPIETLWQF